MWPIKVHVGHIVPVVLGEFLFRRRSQKCFWEGHLDTKMVTVTEQNGSSVQVFLACPNFLCSLCICGVKLNETKERLLVFGDQITAIQM